MKTLIENWNKFLNEEEKQAVDAAEVVRQAWENTSDEHLKTAFAQRAPGGAGSTFDEGTTLETLRDAEWKSYDHDLIESPAQGFATERIGGVLGMLPVDSFRDDYPVRFQIAHMGQARVPERARESEQHKVGKTSYEAVAVFEGGRPERKHTTLLIGPQWRAGHAKDPEKPVIWTFYPGDPTPRAPDTAPQFVTEDDIVQAAPTAQRVDSKFKNADTGEVMPAYVGTIADARAIGFGNIKYSEN